MKPYGPEGAAYYGDKVGTHYKSIEGVTPTVMQALELVAFDSPAENAFSVADYGTADGGLSMTLMKNIIDWVKEKYRPEQQVQIFYEDHPQNDYKSLFHRLYDSPNSYLESRTGVFVSACATEFFSQCFPSNSIHIGICTSAIHWLSRRPCTRRSWFNYLDPECSKEDEKLFAAVAKDDWNRFLNNRARELRKGGQLIISNTNPGHFTKTVRDGDGIQWWKTCVFAQLHKQWKTLLTDEIISQEEFESIVVPVYHRSEEELSAPFKDTTSEVYKAGLRLVSIKTNYVPCSFKSAWDARAPAEDNEFSRRTHAQTYVESIRTWLNSTFIDAVDKTRSEEEKKIIVDKLFLRYEDDVAREPKDHVFDLVAFYVHIRKEK